MAKYVYNRRKDRRDTRDHLFLAKHGVELLPKSVDNRHWFSPIRDQHELGACSAFAAAAGAFEMLERKALLSGLPLDQSPEEFGSIFTEVSTLMQYYNTRLIEGTVDQDSGATIRDAVKALATYGVCPEKMWPYDIAKFAVRPPDEAYEIAAKHRISQYARIYDMQDLRQALAHGLPVICGIQVYSSFEDKLTAETGKVRMPNKDLDKLLGGHAVCVCGYSEDVWLIRNSWSENWGQRGYCELPFSYLQDPDLAEDFWVITK